VRLPQVRSSLIPVFAAVVLFAVGCAPPRATVRVAGDPVMNRNELGESAPVKLRFYPLRDDATFRSATVDALWVSDQDLLKKDLTHEPTITSVFPGASGRDPVKVEVVLGKGAKWLGVLALYNRSDATDRRVLILPVRDAERMVITCAGYSITAEPR